MTSRGSRQTAVAAASSALFVALITVVLIGGWWSRDDQDLPGSASSEARPRPIERVVVVSVDGLASYAISPEAMPELTTLLEEGAGTTNARTIEQTITLPNHTSMVTGRPMLSALGGHGVYWNEDNGPATVRRGVDSVFTVLHDEGLESAVFAGKEKFAVWDRSWPIERFVVNPVLDVLVERAVEDLRTADRALTFIHVANPDAAGHSRGWGSPDYNEQVARADSVIGRVLDAVEDTQTAIIVTADHGGIHGTKGHYDVTNAETYTIPFVVWGPGVAQGDLYELNADYRDPGTDPPSYDEPPAIKNAAVANLATDLLGLDPVPGSRINVDQSLDVIVGTVDSPQRR